MRRCRDCRPRSGWSYHVKRRAAFHPEPNIDEPSTADHKSQAKAAESIGCFEEPVEAPEETARQLDRAYIACVKDSYPARAPFEPFAEAARREGWLQAELPTGHDRPVEMPDAVADLLAAGRTHG